MCASDEPPDLTRRQVQQGGDRRDGQAVGPELSHGRIDPPVRGGVGVPLVPLRGGDGPLRGGDGQGPPFDVPADGVLGGSHLRGGRRDPGVPLGPAGLLSRLDL